MVIEIKVRTKSQRNTEILIVKSFLIFFSKGSTLMQPKFSVLRSSKKHFASRAQAMVEFAIALPVLLMMLFGIIEVSRMAFMYAMVVNSSRDAVRYASAYGRSDNGYLKYSYCTGILKVAKDSGFFLPNPVVTITYDSGPSTSTLGTCDLFASPWEDSDILNVAESGDRVTVTVSVQYKPLVPLIPLRTTTFKATSSRTLLGILQLDN
jgi:Flp pilus assembly protein TadG